MNSNQELINRFYTAFKAKDYRTMQSCYADDTIFSDPVFPDLNAHQVRAMWQMFCVKGQDLEIAFCNISETSDGCTADWTARYVFYATGNQVTNRIHARFIIREGKIIRHTDVFKFYAWARQAFGWKGWLLGWTGVLRKQVRHIAKKNLVRFIEEEQNPDRSNKRV